MEKKTIKGLDNDCEYLPCHEALEDCTFCYCPFYPCYKDDTGGFEKISSRTGKPVWACSDCIFPHKKENVRKILSGLIEFGVDFDLLSKDELMKLRTKI